MNKIAKNKMMNKIFKKIMNKIFKINKIMNKIFKNNKKISKLIRIIIFNISKYLFNSKIKEFRKYI